MREPTRGVIQNKIRHNLRLVRVDVPIEIFRVMKKRVAQKLQHLRWRLFARMAERC